MASKPQKLSSSLGKNNFEPQLLDNRVVISGIAGLYPSSKNVKGLSEILYNKINPVNDKARWTYNHPEVVHFTGKVPDLQYFDAQFFKVHYQLSNNMDSMARKVLEQAYAAIYDAGVNPEQLSGKKVGVYVGTCFSETEKVAFYVTSSRSGFGIAGCNKSMFANRISYWLNIKGPSMSIDDACCSSTAALESAYLAIMHGECEAAIVGGTNICLHPQSSIHYGRIMKLSTDGKTRSFDVNAAGCARSEAINVLFLQKAKDAYRIYADVVHVKSEFTSIMDGENGPRNGFYRNSSDIVGFLKTFYKDAKVEPGAIQYVEAFGSAMLEVDKAELEAIDEVFCENRTNKLLVGSVMSNIGYGEAASGISAITKVLLGYHNGVLAGNLNCESPRQDIAALCDGRMEIVTQNQAFDRSYAAVNSFSVTGVNAHVLLHGHYKPKDLSRYQSAIPHIVLISARQDTAVKTILNDLKSRLIDPEELALLHIFHESRVAGHLGRGFTILDKTEDNKTVSLFETSCYFDGAKRPLWFVYSGMGSQWAGMGKDLMRIPVFATAIERCHKVLQPKGIDIAHIITSPDKTIYDNILHSFVGIAAVQIGLTDILRALEIYPDKIIGHSVGELGCAYADGCFTAEEMILSAYSRGLVSVQTPFIKGSMAAIGLGYQEISKLCPPEIEVACHNGPDSSTISGPAEIMKVFVASLVHQGIFAKEVPCSNIAYHSRYIADAGPGLLKYLSEVVKSPKPRSERWLSTSIPQERWGEPIAKYSSAEYHTNNLLSSVLFEETSKLIPPNALIVEVAPHGLLQAILKRSVPETCCHVPLTRRGHPDNARFVLEAIGRLYMEGLMPKVKSLYPRVEFPVSTGTPMLSHLVEWVHSELWYLPLHAGVIRKTAAACKYIISIHDKENSFLGGHVMRGYNYYPFAATLVAVWDTLAMTLEVECKKLSVMFRDIQLLSQPILHRQRLLRLSVVLHRGTGRFEVMDDIIVIAKGYISGELIDKEMQSDPDEDKLADLNSEEIYQLLHLRDYQYRGDFRSIFSANSELTNAKIIWKNNWVTLIDGMIQMNAIRQSHHTVSQPNFIKRISIDVSEHESTVTQKNDDLVTMKAKILDTHGRTSCGGVVIENIEFLNLPPVDNNVALKSLQFVPLFPVNRHLKDSTVVSIYLQVVSENINKNEINIYEVHDETTYDSIINESLDIPGLNVNYLKFNKENILDEGSSCLTDVDCLIVTNLSNDKTMIQMLSRVLKLQTFILNIENNQETIGTWTSNLYRTLSIHNGASRKFELALWHPISIPHSSTLTVRSPSDLKVLESILETLPAHKKITVLANYPAVAGLKSLIKQHRNKSNKKVFLITLDQKAFEEPVPDQISCCELAFTTFLNGERGGEYFVPIEEKSASNADIVLKTERMLDIDSLYWAVAPPLTGFGLNVKVHYAGINIVDVNRQLGIYKWNKINDHQYTEIDYSGFTERGIRVMGITQTEGIASRVQANLDLLWPVPEHWSLEDAATVPLAYSLAFYILCIKSQLFPGYRILVHGGLGALGQAIISIALAHDCEVFATVSDNNKKTFLKNLFPALKDDHIANSRDNGFCDMVLQVTEGKCCDLVITCSKGELKNSSLSCCGSTGIIFDTALLHEREDYDFGMNSLTLDRSYFPINLSSIFKPDHVEDRKRVQILLSEGIARGYVRPLSRAALPPQQVTRAVRLRAAGRTRGRLLLDLRPAGLSALPRFSCSSESYHVIVSDNEIFGIKMAEKLINSGAKKLILNIQKRSNLLALKTKFWQERGICVNLTFGNITNDLNINNTLRLIKSCGPVESIFIITSDVINDGLQPLNAFIAAVHNLDMTPKHFIVVHTNGTADIHILCDLHNIKDNGITLIFLPLIIRAIEAENLHRDKTVSINTAFNALEKAILSEESVVIAHNVKKTRKSLLTEIASVADIQVKASTGPDVTLAELNMDMSKLGIIGAYLRNVYNISISEERIPTLTLKEIYELEEHLFDINFDNLKGLKTLYTYIEPDELLATIEMVFLPTLTNSSCTRDDEFDVSQTFLCIIPGIEGLHSRFNQLCERLKLAALVMQPGLNNPHETVYDLAQRFAKTLLNKTKLKNKFYLLGYESGIFVALEMAAILEEHGLVGTVFCLGGSPDVIHAALQEQLSEFKTDDDLQLAVVRHMYTLMVNNTSSEELDKKLSKATTWKEKVNACVQSVSGRIPYSIQYAKELIEVAYARIMQMRQYTSRPRALSSLLVYLIPKYSPYTESLSSTLRHYSQQPEFSYHLEAPLGFAPQDLYCASIINNHLDNDIHEAFNKKNLCETYFYNAHVFMTANIDDSD